MRHFKLKDYIISILIVSVALLYFFVDKLVPIDSKTINVFGFPDTEHFVYYSKMKFLIIFFSITWYLTCQHWWKSAILVIITIELLKLITALNVNSKYFDEIDYIISLPITIPIILVLIFVSKKINTYSRSKKLCSKIDTEIDNVFFELQNMDKTQLDFLEKSYKKAKVNKNKDTYKKQLILIRDKFYNKQ